jgi:hypothetical protein
MTHNLQNISDELQRITSYTALLAKLAENGFQAQLESQQLQAVFADISKVTGCAYAEIQDIISTNSVYVDKYDIHGKC